MPRIKWPTRDARHVVKRSPPPDKSRIKKATIIDPDRPELESRASAPAPPAEQPPKPEANFLVQPPDVTRMEDYIRPFVVTASGIPAATLQKDASPYRATLAIYYNNSDIQLLDPSRIIEHTEHWTQAPAKCPGQETTRRIHFIFNHVVIDYTGEFTMVASIFRPGDHIKGPAYLTTPCSTLVKVAPWNQGFWQKPLSDVDDLVYAELGIRSYGPSSDCWVEAWE